MEQKKILFAILTFMLVLPNTFAGNITNVYINNGGNTPVVTYGNGYNPNDQYYQNGNTSAWTIDKWIQERRQTCNNAEAGILTRFGYAYNYDAFTYGFSLLYHWDGYLGVTMGFDGYYMPNMYAVNKYNDTVSLSSYSLPLWDARFGLELGKYFVVGGLLGKSNIDNNNIINMRQDAWFINNIDNNFMYGGFVTFILPISKYFGFNMDFAVTNKTGFNIGIGINGTIPLK